MVSRKAITVLSTGLFSRTSPKSVDAEFPRGIKLGPVDYHPGAFFTLGGVDYEIDEEYGSVAVRPMRSLSRIPKFAIHARTAGIRVRCAAS